MEKVTIPDLTRVEKNKGYVDYDLRIHKALGNLFSTTDNARFFLKYYNQDNAVYRCNFLAEWLQNNSTRNHLDNLLQALPITYPWPIDPFDSYGRPLKEEEIKTQVRRVKKYLLLPETFEYMTQTPGTAQAVKDLKAFAKTTRKRLEEYKRSVEQFKTDPQFKDNNSADYSWANNCLEHMELFLGFLCGISQVRDELRYYRSLCVPYEYEFKGKRIPSCKPIFLDPKERRGRIINAYNPAYFSFNQKTRTRSKKQILRLNVPNDINWGPNSRNNFVIGSNDMGKSVYVDTVGLNIHLAMAGLFCFADYAELSLPRRIIPCFDLGSTLDSGHFVTGGKKVRRMLDEVCESDIVLLDEVAGGTEPEAEQKIAIGITDALIDHNITFFCATHYRQAWESHAREEGVRTLRVADYDDKKRKYKVWQGIARSGYGMRKAEKLGIDPKSVQKRLDKKLKKRN